MPRRHRALPTNSLTLKTGNILSMEITKYVAMDGMLSNFLANPNEMSKIYHCRLTELAYLVTLIWNGYE